MTALIHMGYLGYDPATKSAFIPNEEVRDIFESAIKVGEWNDVSDALRKSDKLLKATIYSQKGSDSSCHDSGA